MQPPRSHVASKGTAGRGGCCPPRDTAQSASHLRWRLTLPYGGLPATSAGVPHVEVPIADASIAVAGLTERSVPVAVDLGPAWRSGASRRSVSSRPAVVRPRRLPHADSVRIVPVSARPGRYPVTLRSSARGCHLRFVGPARSPGERTRAGGPTLALTALHRTPEPSGAGDRWPGPHASVWRLSIRRTGVITPVGPGTAVSWRLPAAGPPRFTLG